MRAFTENSLITTVIPLTSSPLPAQRKSPAENSSPLPSLMGSLLLFISRSSQRMCSSSGRFLSVSGLRRQSNAENGLFGQSVGPCKYSRCLNGVDSWRLGDGKQHYLQSGNKRERRGDRDHMDRQTDMDFRLNWTLNPGVMRTTRPHERWCLLEMDASKWEGFFFFSSSPFCKISSLPSHSCSDVWLGFRNEVLPATVSWQLQGANFQTSQRTSSEQMPLRSLYDPGSQCGGRALLAPCGWTVQLV